MKKVLICMMMLLFTMNSVSAATPNSFNDVPADHWAYQAINELAKVGIIDGFGDNTFQGGKTMTRYEMSQVVAKVIANANKATAIQKTLIDKLGVEFALELNKIDARMKKVEEFNKSTLKVGFDTLMIGAKDNPASGKSALQGNDMWKWRARMNLSGDLNQDTRYEARLTTSFGTAGMTTASTANNTLSFDRVFLTTKGFLGFDSVQWGRMGFNELGGNVGYKTGNNDGVIMIKKLSGSTTYKMGAMVIKAEPAAVGTFTGDAQEVQFASLQTKLNPNVTIGGMFLNNNTTLNTTDTAFNYSNKGSRIAGFSGSYKFNGWTLLGEYDRASLDSPVGVSSNPHTYAIQITNGKVSNTSFYPLPQTLTNINVKGDSAIAVSYRYIEKGAIPSGLSPWGAATLSSPTNLGANSKAVTGVDNIKGWYVSYQYVVAKGIEVAFDSQFLKYADTGAKFDNIYFLMVNTRF